MLFNILAFIASLIWLYKDQSLEPLITVIGLTAGLIALIFNADSENKNIKMKQKGGKNSQNYQAGGDINL